MFQMMSCKYCGYEGDNFYSYNKSKCKSCILEYNRKRNEENPEYRIKENKRNNERITSGKRREYYLKAAYDLTPEKYEEMLTAQGGVCAICKNEDTKLKSDKFSIDHNHTTGEVRGLLCGSCNTGLGLFGDSVDTLMGAAAYLMSSTDILAVEKEYLMRSCNE
jgi:hypothetical protein